MREAYEETGSARRSSGSSATSATSTRGTGERVFKVVSFFLLRATGGRIGDLPAGMEIEVAEARWLPLDDAPRCSPTAASARWPRRRATRSRMLVSVDSRRVPTFALNFYSPVVADQLRTGRKTVTIRLGDKSTKYRKGMIVTVLVGARYGQREKVFDAVIDKVEVKPLAELSPREIEHDNPEIRRLDEFTEWLSRLYNRPVADDDTVTVINFSQILGTMF